MNYFVTIYTDSLLDFEGITHSFIGLTHKSPDELEKDNSKWYEKKYPSIINGDGCEGFFGFGGVEADKKMVFNYIGGKVFENNQYISEYDEKIKEYSIKNIRGDKTFSNRCVLEVSQEQYDLLLINIKKDILLTKDVSPLSAINHTDRLSYNLLSQNCSLWVYYQLEQVGIECIYRENIPDYISLYYPYIKHINRIYNKFASIDNNLYTVNGSIAFREWIRKWHKTKKTFQMQYTYMQDIENIIWLYNFMEQSLLKILEKNIDKQLKGKFTFIYVDEAAFINKNTHVYVLSPNNNYHVEFFDSNNPIKPSNNYTFNKFIPFILDFLDEAINTQIYHQYNYGQVDKEYNQSINECYKQVLLGQTDNIKYYSQSLNKLLNNQKKDNIFNV